MEGMASGDICHYIHKDDTTVAALDLCHQHDVHGLVIKDKRSYEVLPLNARLKRMMGYWNSADNE